MELRNISSAITEAPIDFNSLMASVESPLCGAVATFSGNVRSNDKGREVKLLKYEIHPTTATELQRVVEEICSLHLIHASAVVHRFGEIPIGDAALVVVVSAPHRQSAFAACQQLVDEIKLQIPVWKYQEFSDGTSEWVNSA